jgi:hypothetical protein
MDGILSLYEKMVPRDYTAHSASATNPFMLAPGNPITDRHMQTASETGRVGMIALSRWCESVGLAAVTAWRFRKRGWLKTVNIAGRVYITEAAVQEFMRRAEAGEFARVHKVPPPPGR